MSKFNFKKRIDDFHKLKSTLPILIANDAQRFFVNSFRSESWDDEQPERWKEVKRRIPGTSEYKYPKSKGLARRERKILRGKGRLLRAVNDCIKKTTFEEILFVVETPYAAYHNSGIGQVRRQFIGRSRSLDKKIMQRINSEIKKLK